MTELTEFSRHIAHQGQLIDSVTHLLCWFVMAATGALTSCPPRSNDGTVGVAPSREVEQSDPTPVIGA
jgi:hypothetical protein